MEIYNERLQDLLHAEDDGASPRPRLDLRVHPKVGVYVRNLTGLFRWGPKGVLQRGYGF